MIDFAGPWEVFQDVMIMGRGTTMEDRHVFELYTVSDAKAPIRASGGMRIVPDYTFDDAPPPAIVVVPAQDGRSSKMLAWLRMNAKNAPVVLSVCTGAFVLAEAGILNGKPATTHHGAYAQLQRQYPEINVQRDLRYVQSDDVIATAGGLSSGIDLALHVVDRAFGREVAEATARQMEYEGLGWKDGKAAVSYTTTAVAPSPADGLTTGVLGNWKGTLVLQDGSFRVVFHAWRAADGAITASIDSLDENVSNFGVSAIRFDGSAVHFEVPSIGGAYDGKLDSGSARIDGRWTQHGIVTPLALVR